MDPERQRIQDDLRGLVEGEVRCDDVFVQMYASDASIFEVEPMGVVRPRNTGDVVAVVQYARENGFPIHARGSGTGVAGGCLGRGIVLDFSHSMRRILRIDDTTARVQAGVVQANLNTQLANRNRMFGPDPANQEVTTMGAVMAVNRGGSHWLRYGAARNRVVGMQAVLSDGTVLEAGKHALNDRSSPHNNLVNKVAHLISKNQLAIQESKPASLVNTSGYQLDDVLENETLDLAKVLVGSEGTLGLITEVTVATDPIPKATSVALLFFERFEKATRAVHEILKYEVSACDLVDRRLLSLARDSDLRYEMLLPKEAEAVLIVEVCGDEHSEVRDRLRQITNQICRRKRLAFDSNVASDPSDLQLYWQLAQRVLPSLYRLTGTQRALPFVEDIAVPPASLPDFITRTQNVFKHHQVIASLFAHAGHGQLHLRPFLDLANPDDVNRMQRLATDLYEIVLEFNGTISGEHGNGLSRSWFVRRQYPRLYPVFRELKRIFDPAGILNPGKVTESEPLQLMKSLRPVTVAPPRPDKVAVTETDTENESPPTATAPDSPGGSLELLLNWNEHDVALAARSCNGCGSCRTQSDAMRMCPIFRFAPAEEASPRAKANMMRGIFTGQISPEQLADDELKQVADLCVNCHQCRDECPAGVDIPKLMIEYKAQYVATNGLSFSDWILSRLDLIAPIASRLRPLTNFAIGNRRIRWLLERIIGLAQGRKLPRIATRPFLAVAKRRRLTRTERSSGQKVLYFTDLYANWFDLDVADAFVQVFQHNGVSVYVPPTQIQSGMSLIAIGAIEKAKQLAATNIAMLADAVRQGYHIVTSEPSAALCLTREYPNMFNDDDVRLISENTSEACSYLWKMHQRGQLELDFKPLNLTIGYHLPCHSRALGEGTPAEHLLRLIPGLTVRSIDKGCSGMAGTYGLKRENYRNSLRAGWPLISAIREPSLNVGSTECSTCKMQMEQGTSKPTIHPLKLLAFAYGVMPEISNTINHTGEELFVS